MIDTSNLPAGAVLNSRDVGRISSSNKQKISIIVEYTYSTTDENGISRESAPIGYDVKYLVDGDLTAVETVNSLSEARDLAGRLAAS